MTAMTDQIPVLDTPRLTLRAPRLSDLATMTAFYQTGRSHMVGGPTDAFGTFTKLTARIGHWAFHGFGFWHIDNRKTGDFLGWAGVIHPPGWAEPELGWALFDHAEGQGFAFEAAMAARAFTAQHLGLDGVISYINPQNDRSAALARRLGAVHESQGVVVGTLCHIYRHPRQDAA